MLFKAVLAITWLKAIIFKIGGDTNIKDNSKF